MLYHNSLFEAEWRSLYNGRKENERNKNVRTYSK